MHRAPGNPQTEVHISQSRGSPSSIELVCTADGVQAQIPKPLDESRSCVCDKLGLGLWQVDMLRFGCELGSPEGPLQAPSLRLAFLSTRELKVTLVSYSVELRALQRTEVTQPT